MLSTQCLTQSLACLWCHIEQLANIWHIKDQEMIILFDSLQNRWNVLHCNYLSRIYCICTCPRAGKEGGAKICKGHIWSSLNITSHVWLRNRMALAISECLRGTMSCLVRMRPPSRCFRAQAALSRHLIPCQCSSFTSVSHFPLAGLSLSGSGMEYESGHPWYP